MTLAAILGEVSRFVMGVHIGGHVQSSFIDVSCEVTPICQGFQNTVCACLIANESSKMAGYIAHGFLSDGYPQGIFSKGAFLAVSMMRLLRTKRLFS